MESKISKSQFYMWRTLFAVAHADDIVTKEEVEFMAQILEDVDFSDEQTEILKDDIVNAKDIELMFKGITDQEDRIKFFEFARDLVWIDGDFGEAEQSVMINLFRDHFRQINVDDLIGKVRLQFEDEAVDRRSYDNSDNELKKSKINNALNEFQKRFVHFFSRK